ncbi:MAG: ribosome assembly cofactor RimP [Chitinophagaceae bacterium]
MEFTSPSPYICSRLKKESKGTDTVPFLFAPMATEAQIQFVDETVKTLLEDLPACFLVQITVSAGNNIKVFLDGDEGITIDKCIKLNRALYRHLEEQQTFPADDFSLEVSSAGVGEPLLMHRQYVKNTGRFVEVTTNDGQLLEGSLKSVAEEDIVVETTTGKGKKLEIKEHIIPFDNIKSTIVQIKF